MSSTYTSKIHENRIQYFGNVVYKIYKSTILRLLPKERINSITQIKVKGSHIGILVKTISLVTKIPIGKLTVNRTNYSTEFSRKGNYTSYTIDSYLQRCYNLPPMSFIKPSALPIMCSLRTEPTSKIHFKSLDQYLLTSTGMFLT